MDKIKKKTIDQIYQRKSLFIYHSQHPNKNKMKITIAWAKQKITLIQALRTQTQPRWFVDVVLELWPPNIMPPNQYKLLNNKITTQLHARTTKTNRTTGVFPNGLFESVWELRILRPHWRQTSQKVDWSLYQGTHQGPHTRDPRRCWRKTQTT